VFAVAIVLAGGGPKLKWLIGLVAVAVAHVVALSVWAPGSELSWEFAMVLVFTVFLPWLAAGIFLAASPFPRNAWLVAGALPLVHIATWGLGAYIGLATGALHK